MASIIGINEASPANGAVAKQNLEAVNDLAMQAEESGGRVCSFIAEIKAA